MAELGVIGLMISSTATAAGVLGVIKRRCGASERMVALTEKCVDQVLSIKELLQTLEEGTKLPYDTRSLSTALNQRCREFKAIQKQLGKVNRRTKRASRTERFTMAQGWVKQLEAIYMDLQVMRQDVQQLMVSWESRRVVVAAIQDTMTIDATRHAERHDRMAIWGLDSEESDVLVSASNADRIFLTGVNLSPRDWKALSRYGRLDELSLPDALYVGGLQLGNLHLDLHFWSSHAYEFSERALYCLRHSVRLLSLAAELQHPYAHLRLGWAYYSANYTEFDLDSSIFHFRIAVESGDKWALYGLSRVYDGIAEPEKALNYLTRAAEHDIRFSIYLVLRLTMDARHVHNVEEARKWLNRCTRPLFQSFCYLFGIAVERDEREAVQFAEKLKIDDVEYRVSLRKETVVPKSFLEVRDPDGVQLLDVCHALEMYASRFKPEMFKEWIDFLFDNGLQSMILSQLESIRPDWFESYAVRAAREGNVVAHLALACYSTERHPEDQDWRRAEQHLRIASEMGHSNAQEVCRELFGDTEKASRGIKNVEEVMEM